MHPQHCERVTQSCKNARCDLNLCSSKDGLAGESILGPCVRSVRILWPAEPVDEPKIAAASLACTGLEELLVVDCDESAPVVVVKGLLCHRMPLLTSCTIDISDLGMSEEEVAEALQALGSCAAILREFNFAVSSKTLGAFAPVARGVPMLQSVVLRFYLEAPDCYDDRLDDAVRSFLGCSELRHLQLRYKNLSERARERITNMCRRVNLSKRPDLNIDILIEGEKE